MSLAEHAYAQLRDRIVLLDVRPGDPLDDAAIAAELGAGRTPVREALKRLEGDRLVVAYPRRGTFATAIDITDLAHISDIRTALEPVAAARAARHASAAARAGLTDLAAALPGLTGERELLRHDVAVHRALYRATGNPHLEDVLVRQDNHATRIWGLFVDRLPGLATHVGEHAALLDAVVGGDEEKAAQLALEHVTGFERAVRAVM
jgi:DNA-binding GntR family transcriptional regulator